MSIQIGCGLIGIGREWGHRTTALPDEKAVMEFLEQAVAAGIRYFDTAPSYGLSEERLGEFLSTLTPDQRSELTIATKFGEHWNHISNQPYVDHSLTGLKASLDQSLQRLGQIDILQLHKTSPAVLQSRDLVAAWEYATSLGIKRFGASVSDADSANLVCFSDTYTVLQLPFNSAHTAFLDTIALAKQQSKFVVTNRVLNMGALLYGPEQTLDKDAILVRAYQAVLDQNFDGVVLTGTKSVRHLHENIQAFNYARSHLTIPT